MTERTTSGWAVGWTTFAALMMIMIGFWHAIAGLVALFEDQFYVVGAEYVFQLDVTTWGWIHLILGVVVGLAGVALFSGATWARTIGVILAVVSGVIAAANRGDDAELRCARCGSLLSCLDQHRDVEPGRANRRVEDAGL